MYNSKTHPSMMISTMPSFPVMIVLHKKILVPAICRKCYRCNSQARKASLKSIESRERSAISPCFSVNNQYTVLPNNCQPKAHFLAHGSFAGEPADAANAFGSKPVRFARGALRTLPIVNFILVPIVSN